MDGFKLTMRQYETVSHLVYAFNYLHTNAGLVESAIECTRYKSFLVKHARASIMYYLKCIGAPDDTVCQITAEGTDFTIFSVRLERCDNDEQIRETNIRRMWFNANVGEGKNRGVPEDKMIEGASFNTFWQFA